MESSVKTGATLEFGTSYFKQVFADVDTLLSNAETQLKGQKIDFDSMVGIGLSGILALPILARHFNVPFLALRKPGVDSHDSYGIGQYGRGTIGKRWILVDDFVSTGETMRNAERIVTRGIKAQNDANGTNFKSEFVGVYCYGSSYGEAVGSFVYPDNVYRKVSITMAEFSGETIAVDTDLFRRMKRQIMRYKRRGNVDAKGQAITYLKEQYICYLDSEYRPTVAELARLAIIAEREINEGNDRFVNDND